MPKNAAAKKKPQAINHPHLDASESIFLGNQLTLIKQKAYEFDYGPMKARSLIPAATETDPNAKVVIWHTYDRVGMAKIIASYADDLPRADVKATDNVAMVKTLGSSYGYNVDEIGFASANGVPLEQRKANAARQAIEQLIDSIGAKGDSANNMVGFLNQPNALVYTVPNGGTSGTTFWAGKTADEVIKDLNGVLNYARTQSKETVELDTLVLPLTQKALIATTPRSGTSDTTIQKFFQANLDKPVDIESWALCAGAGAGGTDRGVGFVRNLDVLEFHIPLDFEQRAAEPRSLEIVVPCRAKIAGVFLFRPLGMVYFDGI